MRLTNFAVGLDASERQHVHGARHGCEWFAAFQMIQPAETAKSVRVMREIDAHASLFGSDRSIAVLAPRFVRAIPPPGIEVQGYPPALVKGQSRSHDCGTPQNEFGAPMDCNKSRKFIE